MMNEVLLDSGGIMKDTGGGGEVMVMMVVTGSCETVRLHLR
jgi:hypothetical protein